MHQNMNDSSTKIFVQSNALQNEEAHPPHIILSN